MANDISGGGVLRSIVDAGKGSIDFLAFALIGVLSVASLIGGRGLLESAGIAGALAIVWVIMRYALLKLQARERLRRIKEDATIQALKKLVDNATKDEIADLFRDLDRIGDDHGR